MNREQKAYALAKARKESIEDRFSKHESEWIRNHGIQNPDGTTPKFLWMMDDDEESDKRIEEYCNLPEVIAMNEELNQSKEALKEAEEKLIDYGLSIVPAEIRDTLNSKRDHWKYRDKLINLTFSLDTTTVPKERS